MARVPLPLQAHGRGRPTAVGGAASTASRLADVVRRARPAAGMVRQLPGATAGGIAGGAGVAAVESIPRPPAPIHARAALSFHRDRPRDAATHRRVVAPRAAGGLFPGVDARADRTKIA